MYHRSGSAVQQAAGSATALLDPLARGSFSASAPASAPALTPASTSDAILFQRCTWCGTAMYHRVLCPVCRGSDLRTERSEGTGTVRHSTVVHRNTPAARNVSLVEMTEGFVVRGRVMGPPIGIHSGDRVRLSTVKDPVRGEPVFQLLDEPYRAWR
ncbi:Zn-ribbon domain-containing OB-fold protein [Streptomyces griseus]|uniref:Zn-ribbon domain-containing OB-fold protein n=1 Tax=Streptomyces griseus TaxID=1911 RepID=UPI0005617B03|nr:zinc ribbon domain-containing protein [Streptomyces griseus]